jgi:nicotinamide-nucleotide amidase
VERLDLDGTVSAPDDSKAAHLLELCRQRGLKLATAESCTGGLIIGRLTDIAGSSDVVDRGFVTYSNAAKTEMIGVPATLIARFGAVSEAVARAMAEGALAHSNADIAIAVTGIAGPGGATPGKPVGLVHFACARRGGETRHMRQIFSGDRAAIRQGTVEAALDLLSDAAQAER